MFDDSTLNYKVHAALHKMCQASKNQTRYKKSSKEFDRIRRRCSKNNTGPGNPNFGKKWTDEQRKRKSESQMGEKNHMFGKTRPKEFGARISEVMTGRIVSDYTRAKQSASRTGKKLGPFSESHIAAMVGIYWWTNGATEVKSKIGPDGFWRGRKPKATRPLSPESDT